MTIAVDTEQTIAVLKSHGCLTKRGVFRSKAEMHKPGDESTRQELFGLLDSSRMKLILPYM